MSMEMQFEIRAHSVTIFIVIFFEKIHQSIQLQILVYSRGVVLKYKYIFLILRATTWKLTSAQWRFPIRTA